MERNTINNDDTYRDPEGCIVSVLAVVIIFAIAAGLWLFQNECNMKKERYNELLEQVAMLLFTTIMKNYPPPPIQTEEVMKACAKRAKTFIDEIEALSKL